MLYRVANLTQVYGGRTVLDLPELSIQEGKIYTLLGPNGAGKTTLLKILALLDKPSTGRMEFLGRRVSWDKALFRFRRDVVLLDQSPILFSGSVMDNVGYGLAIRNIAKKERKERSLEALRQVGMEHFAFYDARGLSGGETKRVALARALVLRPRVLICDEPTANVDNENQTIIFNILRLLREKLNTSVIFSTHYLAQSSGLAEEQLVLQNGRLTDTVIRNVYYGTRVSGDGRFATVRVSCGDDRGTDVRLPQSLCPSASLRLEVDSGRVCIGGDGSTEDGIFMEGRVTLLETVNDTVRVGIDAGIPVSLSLSMAGYSAAKAGLTEKIRLFIPYPAITVLPCSSS